MTLDQIDGDAVADALFDLYDVRSALSERIKRMPKDNEGSIFTIGDCLDNAIAFLESIDPAGQVSDESRSNGPRG